MRRRTRLNSTIQLFLSLYKKLSWAEYDEFLSYEKKLDNSFVSIILDNINDGYKTRPDSLERIILTIANKLSINEVLKAQTDIENSIDMMNKITKSKYGGAL